MFAEDLDIFLADFGEEHLLDGVTVRCIIGDRINGMMEGPASWNRSGIEGTAVESMEITYRKDSVISYLPTQSLNLDGIVYHVGAVRDDGAIVTLNLSRKLS
jgi:hypothetical protein